MDIFQLNWYLFIDFSLPTTMSVIFLLLERDCTPTFQIIYMIFSEFLVQPWTFSFEKLYIFYSFNFFIQKLRGKGRLYDLFCFIINISSIYCRLTREIVMKLIAVQLR